MHFGENQLSPGSFGILLLPTAHPSPLHWTPVRTSTPLSRGFVLSMGSSPGFRSTPRNSRRFQTRFRSGSVHDGLNLAAQGNSPARDPRRTPSSRPVGQNSDRLEAHGFRFSFTPLPGFFSPFPHGTGTLSVGRVFSLGGWAPQLPTGFHVSRGTQAAGGRPGPFAYRAVTFSGGSSQSSSARARLVDFLAELRLDRPALTTPARHRPADH